MTLSDRMESLEQQVATIPAGMDKLRHKFHQLQSEIMGQLELLMKARETHDPNRKEKGVVIKIRFVTSDGRCTGKCKGESEQWKWDRERLEIRVTHQMAGHACV